MFNDLNQAGSPEPKTAVDDIFSDVDKAPENKNFSGYYANPATPAVAGSPSEIETQKVGLAETESLPVSSKGKILKIGLIILLVLLLGGLGYLVYAKFLVNQPNEQPVVAEVSSTTDKVVEVEQATTTLGQDLINEATNTEPIIEDNASSSTVDTNSTTTVTSSLADTDGDGLSDEEEKILGTDSNVKDTDGDGLSDYDEIKVYNTDPKNIDNDVDGLSDYEEVKIYKSDPLKADTDSDGYDDGAEVKGGYDPLLPGKKMSDTPAVTPGL
jgi:hypothetical protein